MSTSLQLFAAYTRNLQRIKWDQIMDCHADRVGPATARVPSLVAPRSESGTARIDQSGSLIGVELLLAEIQARTTRWSAQGR